MHHRLLISLAGALTAMLVPTSASAGVPLYPDLETLPAHELSLDRTDVSADGSKVMHNVLRFSNTTWNNGEGRADIRAQIDPRTKEGPAVERVHDSDGNWAEFPVGRLYYHAAHDHYHFDDWGEYQLWTRTAYDNWEASGRQIGNAHFVGSKTTSCMMDVEIVGNLPSTPYPAQFPGTGCGAPNSSGLIVEGLSVGWGDTYESSRSEQWIDLDQATLPDGNYVLRSIADPNNRIYESPAKGDAAREGAPDNEAITPFRIVNGQIADSNPPGAPTVVIDSTAEETSSPTVSVAVRGRDDVSGIDQFRLSNDGNQWKTFTYSTGGLTASTKVSWNLSDPAYGGSATGGTHTVYAQVHDRAGNWSTVGTDTIGLQSGPSGTTYAAAVQADSPRGWWRLGETSGTTAGDSAGANPGTYRNGAVLGRPSLLASDPANPSAAFDGVNDHVSVPDATAISPTGSFSLEAWIKPDAIPTTGSFTSVATKAGSYSIQFNGPRLEFTIIQAGTRRRAQAPAGAVAAGQTYHVVGTYDGTFSRLYLNGAEVAILSVSGGPSVTTSPLTVGAWSATDEFLDGTIDEAAIYGTALSSTRVRAHHAAGTTGAADPVPAPTNLAASASAGRIDLTWTDNSSTETAFVIERDTDSGFSAPTTVTRPANTTSYSDTGLADARKYYYRVRAHNDTDTSGWSNVASATTPDPVAAPSQLAATAASPTKVDLTWLDNSTNENEFLLERSTSSTFSPSTTSTLPANTTAHSDTTVAGATTYHYRLRARNDSDTSPYSNVATVTTPAPPPPPIAAPSGLTATAASASRIDLRWTDNSSNETSFVVERDTSSTFASPTALSAPTNATTFADTGLAAGTTYHYRVRARNATDQSPNSNVASATTQQPPPPPPPPGASYADTVRADAPVSHWRLGETSGTAAADAMGVNAGTYVNAPTLGSPSLLGSDTADRSATFDGALDHVRIRDSASLRLTSPFTLEAWIRPAAIPASGSFASVMSKEDSYSIQFNGPRLEVTIMQSRKRMRVQAPAGAVVAGSTYHVVATYDGATSRLYLNGAQAASRTLSGGATATTNPLVIASWDGREEFMRGTVDEVAVYRTALSAAQVSAHYSAGR